MRFIDEQIYMQQHLYQQQQKVNLKNEKIIEELKVNKKYHTTSKIDALVSTESGRDEGFKGESNVEFFEYL